VGNKRRDAVDFFYACLLKTEIETFHELPSYRAQVASQTFRILWTATRYRTLAMQSRTSRGRMRTFFLGTPAWEKTTARAILAKAMNCVEGRRRTLRQMRFLQGNCRGHSLDVIEIDAASTAALTKYANCGNVRYAPAASRSKVVILDEAHMLPASVQRTAQDRESPRSRDFRDGDNRTEIWWIRFGRVAALSFRAADRLQRCGRLEEIGKKRI